MSERRSETISPTAHYTGYVWYANGLSHPAFATREGRLFYEALRPANAAARAIGGPTLDIRRRRGGARSISRWPLAVFGPWSTPA